MIGSKFVKVAAQIAVLGALPIALSGCAAGHSKSFGEICDNASKAIEYANKWSSIITPHAVDADKVTVQGDISQQFNVDSAAYVATMKMYAENITAAMPKLDSSEAKLKKAAEQTFTDAEKFKEDLRTYLTQFNAEPIDWMLSSTSTTTDFLTLSSLCLAN